MQSGELSHSRSEEQRSTRDPGTALRVLKYIGAVTREAIEMPASTTRIRLLLLLIMVAFGLPELFFDVPDVFLLGAPKSGTTSLAYLLRSHPSVCNYGSKEKHYFDVWKTKTENSMRLYKNEFLHCNATQLTLDATPAYLRKPTAPSNVMAYYRPEDLGRKKFIVYVCRNTMMFPHTCLII